MIKERSPRTVPCNRCRVRHFTCEWPASSSSSVGLLADTDKSCCMRCQRDVVPCSGPQPKVRTTPPPCDSCKRKRTRCVWNHDQSMCKRCQDRGLGVCPLPPRARIKSAESDKKAPSRPLPVASGQATVPPIEYDSGRIVAASRIPLGSPTYVRSDAWESVLTQNMRQNLAIQGKVRLGAAGFSYLPVIQRCIGPHLDLSIDKLSILVFSISGLKFCNVSAHESQTLSQASGPGILVLDTVRTDQWLANPLPKATLQDSGLQALFPLAWQTAFRLVTSTPMEGSEMYRMIVALVLLVHLSVEPLTGFESMRTLLGYVVMALAVELQKRPMGDIEAQIMAVGSLKLIFREHHASVYLGKPSLITRGAIEKIVSRLDERDWSELRHQTQCSSKGTQSSKSDCFDPFVSPMHVKTVLLSQEILDANCLPAGDFLGQARQLLDDIDSFREMYPSKADNPGTDPGRSASLLELRVLEVCMVIIKLTRGHKSTSYASDNGQGDPPASIISQTVAALSMESLCRIARILRESMERGLTLLVDLYAILDAATYVLNLGVDHLSPLMHFLSTEDASIIIRALVMTVFWECKATHLLPLYRKSVPHITLGSTIALA